MPDLILNEQQRVVVDDLSGNFLLLAPAGTGKTNTLSARIARILDTGAARAEEILCLTFTNRACREMLERVKATVGEKAEGVTVRTVHGFGYHLLLDYGDMAGFGGGDTGICDEDDSLAIIRELLPSGEEPWESGRKARLMAEFMEIAKHQMYRDRTADIRAAAERTFAAEEERVRHICTGRGFAFDPALYAFLRENGAPLMNRYQRLLAERKLYDFHDLVLQMGMLLENGTVRDLLRSRYRYVHIDEVQDISDVEYDILTRMCPEAVFLLCGDANQTIYGWRGSVPGEILPKFERDFAARRVYLEENYRATKGLVNLGERFSAVALEGKEPQPPRYTDRDAVIMGHDTLGAQAKWMFDTVRELDVDGDYSKIAVLCRSNAQCERIAREFARLRRQEGDGGVRFMLAEEFKLFKTQEVKDILAFVRLTRNPQDDTALARVAQSYGEGIGRGTVSAVGALREPPGIRLSDYISDAVQRQGDFFSPLTAALERGDVVVFDVESTGVDIYNDAIIQVAAVRIDREGRAVEKLMEYIRPRKLVGDSVKVHHITDEFLREHGKSPAEALETLCRFLADTVVVGHNVGYDMGILEAELRRWDLPPASCAAVYDTLDMARRFLPDLENHKLETLARYFDTPHKPSHDAMEDILATGDLLIALTERYVRPPEAERREAYAQYAPRFRPLCGELVRLRELAPELDAAAFCTQIARRFEMRKRFETEPARLQNIAAFLRFLREPVFAGTNWRQNLSAVLEYAALSSSELDRMSRELRKLSIITVHQAKGCEFDYVFVPCLVEDAFPNWPSIQNDTVPEEARLFYVAVTRARKKLFLTWHRRDEKTGRRTKPSRFLYQL